MTKFFCMFKFYEKLPERWFLKSVSQSFIYLFIFNMFILRKCYFWETCFCVICSYFKKKRKRLCKYTFTVRTLLKAIFFLLQYYNYQSTQVILPLPCLFFKHNPHPEKYPIPNLEILTYLNSNEFLFEL